MTGRMMVTAAIALALGGCGGNGGSSGATTGTDGPTSASTGGGGDIVLTRDAAIGAPYGAPGPRSCSTDTVPASGAPNADQIAKYVICNREGKMGDYLYLVDQVQVTAISAGRPYNPNEDTYMSKIDINQPVYDIAGSMVGYQCNVINQPGGYDGGEAYNPGKQCRSTAEAKATGLCYINTLHQWWCSMQDEGAKVANTKELQPPPPAD